MTRPIGENDAKWPHFEKVRTGHERWRACQFASSPVQQWHGPITRKPGGVARSLRCGTVSNAFVQLSQFSAPTSWPGKR